MFTTKNVKKYLFALIGTIFVVCLFSSFGCSKQFNVPGPPVLPKPDQILQVDAKLQVSRKDFVIDWRSSGPLHYVGGKGIYRSEGFIQILQNYPLVYIGEGVTIGKRHLGGPYIHLKEKAELVIQNGTRYICTNPDGCEIIDFVITKGSIEVYHNKNDK